MTKQQQLEDRLQNQVSHLEVQLKVKVKDLKRAEKLLHIRREGETGERQKTEALMRGKPNVTLWRGAYRELSAERRREALHRAAGRQRGGLQKGALLQKRRGAPKTNSLKNRRTIKRSSWEALQRGLGRRRRR